MLLRFGPDRRLRRHSEFSRAQRTGRRVTTPHFVLLVAVQPGSAPPHAEALPEARLGIVVARKIGSAVRRNRVKRLCRECFRQEAGFLPPGVDLIVIARPGADELGLGELRSEWGSVRRLLRKRAAEALARAAGPDHPAADGSW